MPTVRSGLSTSAVNGKIYAFGGSVATSNPFPALSPAPVEVYDPATDTWTTKADIPTPRNWLATSAVNGKIYAIGGGLSNQNQDILSTVEAYNPITDNWTQKTDMPTARVGLGTSVVDGKIYAIGGWNGSFVAAVEVYDPTTDTWSKRTPMPTRRAFLATAVVNEKIYAIGGTTIANESIVLPTVEEYDPATDTWTRKTDMPTSRDTFSTNVVDGKIYAIGGWDSHRRVATVEVYNPITDTWETKTDMPTIRSLFSASVVNGRIYAIGGIDSGSIKLSTVEAYDTGVGISVELISRQEGRAAGGESITILGTGFPQGVVVTIGGNPLANTTITETLITGLTPPGMAGEQIVQITVPGFDYPFFAGQFLYLTSTPIVITAVMPSSGPASGGQTVTIEGSGFAQGAVISFALGPANDITPIEITPTRITFITPPNTRLGEAPLTVYNPDGEFNRKFTTYTFTPAPIIETIEPDNGTVGTTISIAGENFMEGVVVFVGETEVQPNRLNSRRLRFDAPPIPEGEGTRATVQGTRATIRVVNPDEGFAEQTEGFTYNRPPRIADIKPERGPVSGDTELTILGSFFRVGVAVIIGDVTVEQLDDFFGSELRLTTPPNTAGSKTIRVINPDGQEAVLEDAFTYFDPELSVDLQGLLLTAFGEVKHTTLLQNYPNPFNPETWIPYALAEDADVRLAIYNLKGELVRTLAVGRQTAGVYLSREQAAYWDGTDSSGQPVASGVYFYQLVAGEVKQVRRMVVVK